jgi:hypothetical protein
MLLRGLFAVSAILLIVVSGELVENEKAAIQAWINELDYQVPANPDPCSWKALITCRNGHIVEM